MWIVCRREGLPRVAARVFFCVFFLKWRKRLTTLLSDLGDLGKEGGVNEWAQVDATDVVDEAKVEGTEVQGGQIEVAEETSILEGQDSLQLLEGKQGVDVEDTSVEQALEAENVEVVLEAEVGEVVQVQPVDGEEVVQVKVLEAIEAVEETQVELASLLNLGGGSGRDDGSESANNDSGELHFDG
jgi:hypothetical protein